MKERKNHWYQDINWGEEKLRSLKRPVECRWKKKYDINLEWEGYERRNDGERSIGYRRSRLDNWAWMKRRQRGTNNGEESLIWKEVRQTMNLEIII